MKKFKRYTVTSALPYANGPVHIGHLAGVYIPSDIYTRYLRIKGQDVISVCGSDEHGVPITLKAKKEGITPQQVVDRYHKIIKDSFKEFGIEFDIYSRTSNKIHHETAAEMFRTINEKGGFIEKTTKQYYDTEAKQFLADRYITGTCPHCNYEAAYGDQCEKCGTSLSATELIRPKSAISGAKPSLRETRHWYLPLDKSQAFLEKWILEDHKDWRPLVTGQCKSWFQTGLQPRAVSRDLDWGVPVPAKNAEGKVLYVWFDAPIGYISATKEYTPDWEKYWKNEDTKLVHFIGKDNIVFHCIIFPAMLKSAGDYILPENVPANAFLNLEGNKISTSKNWAVWLHEYLRDFEGQQDALRYALTAAAPESKDNDFTWRDLQAKNNNELTAVFGNFVNRAAVLTQKYYNNKVPQPNAFNQEDEAVFEKLVAIKAKIENNIENYHFRAALKEMMQAARIGNKYLADSEPWKLVKIDPERVKTILYVALQITATLAVLCEPFLPFTAVKLKKILSTNFLNWENAGTKNILPTGHTIGKAELLFAKVEDAQIEAQMKKLSQAKKNNQMENKSIAAQKATISFEDFSKADIRTGTILEATKVPKTKKLLKLLVDTGLDTRTVVSGIAEYYKPEEVLGKKVSILINLAPRKLKGIESQGMILMAEDAEGKLIFITPQGDAKNGTEVN